jgi:hypothetical protein
VVYLYDSDYGHFTVCLACRERKQLTNAAAGAQAGVSRASISRWNIKLGLSSHDKGSPSHHPNRPLIEADDELGLFPDPYFAEKYDCSRYLISDIRKERGIPAYGKVKSRIEYVPAWQSAYFNNWKRPQGIDEVLQEIAE